MKKVSNEWWWATQNKWMYRRRLYGERMYIASLEREFIYIPVSKVANTAIKVAIADALGFPRRVAGFGYPVVPRTVANQVAFLKRRVQRRDPPQFQVHSKHFGWQLLTLPQVAQSRFFRFAFVRNPFERLVSCYYNKVANQHRQRDYSSYFVGVPTTWSFGEFARWALAQAVPDHHYGLQSRYMVHNGKLCADFVGRYESLEADWAKVAGRFELGVLPSMNVSTRALRGPYQSLFDPELRMLANEFYREDLDRFGYDPL